MFPEIAMAVVVVIRLSRIGGKVGGETCHNKPLQINGPQPLDSSMLTWSEVCMASTRVKLVRRRVITNLSI